MVRGPLPAPGQSFGERTARSRELHTIARGGRTRAGQETERNRGRARRREALVFIFSKEPGLSKSPGTEGIAGVSRNKNYGDNGNGIRSEWAGGGVGYPSG